MPLGGESFAVIVGNSSTDFVGLVISIEVLNLVVEGFKFDIDELSGDEAFYIKFCGD